MKDVGKVEQVLHSPWQHESVCIVFFFILWQGNWRIWTWKWTRKILTCDGHRIQILDLSLLTSNFAFVVWYIVDLKRINKQKQQHSIFVLTLASDGQTTSRCWILFWLFFIAWNVTKLAYKINTTAKWVFVVPVKQGISNNSSTWLLVSGPDTVFSPFLVPLWLVFSGELVFWSVREQWQCLYYALFCTEALVCPFLLSKVYIQSHKHLASILFQNCEVCLCVSWCKDKFSIWLPLCV